MTVNEKIIRVRELMSQRGLDAYLVLTGDPHGSEYPAEYWKTREFLSGFNGSAGTLLVTANHAGLWVDSRYYIQAELQTKESCIEVFKMGLPHIPDYIQYLTETLPSGSVLGVDGFTLPYDIYKQMKKRCSSFGIKIDHTADIINDIFAPRQDLPLDEVIEMDPTIAGLNRLQKVDLVRQWMLKNNISHYIATGLDNIAWLTNLRGTDIEYNPVFYAYMIITQDTENLYINPHKLTSVISHRLDEDGFKVSHYDHFEKNLKNIPGGSVVYYDPKTTNTRVVMSLPSTVRKIEQNSYISHLKGCKTNDEINHIYACHVRDGVALVKFLRWLDETVGKEPLTELSIAAKLLEKRKENQLFMSESFAPISAYGSNAAIVHYSPTPESNAQVNPQGLLLLDTGAQYADGTTDITRTIALGPLSDDARRDYTLVLKGHIALARARFPQGTRGVQLDTFARMALWNEGEDYGHGTGHGVGFCLNVHEGPQRIAKTDNGVPLEAGMLTSNEPGVYREGKYGIRIENLVVCENDITTEFGQFLRFRTITMCPIDTRPVIVDMLTEEEKKWLNNYHHMVCATLYDLLNDEADRKWLTKVTTEI